MVMLIVVGFFIVSEYRKQQDAKIRVYIGNTATNMAAYAR